MEILKKTIMVDPDTFVPDIHVTVSIPIELIKNDLLPIEESDKEKLDVEVGKEFMQKVREAPFDEE